MPSKPSTEFALFRQARLKWTLIFSLLLFLFVSVLFLLFNLNTMGNEMREFDNKIQAWMKVILLRIEKLPIRSRERLLVPQLPLADLFLPEELSIQWLDGKGEVVLTFGKPLPFPPENVRPGFQTLQVVESNEAERQVDQFRVLTQLFEWEDGERPHVMRVGQNLSSIEQKQAFLWWRTAFSLVLTLFFSGIIGRGLSLWALAPIQKSYQNLKDFSSEASHELKTPVTIIQATLERIRAKPLQDPELEKKIQTLWRANQRMDATIHKLLMLSRGETLELEAAQAVEMDSSAFSARMLDAYQGLAAKKNIVLKSEIPRALKWNGFPEWMDHVVGNLLENAIKFSPEGSEVLLHVLEKQGNLHIQVEDHGPGMNAEEKRRMFERFFRGEKARAQVNGSGLGLAIVKALAEKMNLQILVDSQPNHGTRITLVQKTRVSLLEP